MTLRDLFVLQNTIHWIKSIAIDDHRSRRPAGDAQSFPQEAATAFARSAISSRSIRRDFSTIATNMFFISRSPVASNSNRLALGVPYQDKSNIARWSHTRGRRSALPREHVVRSLRNNSKPRERTAASGDVSSSTRRMVYQTARSVARPTRCSILFSASVIPPSRAQRCGVKKFIGFEIDDAYLAEAKRRIASGRGARSRK